MKIPSKVTIYGQDYKIKFEKDCQVNGIPCEGYCNTREYVIYLDVSLKKKPAFLKEVLIHEMGHGLLDRLGFHLVGFPPELEEILVQAVAVMMNENFKISLN